MNNHQKAQTWVLVLAACGDVSAAVAEATPIIKACSQGAVEVVWLEQPVAAEVRFSASQPEVLRGKLAELSARHHCDSLLLPEKGRLKKLLISDMDSTVIINECIDEMADMMGLKDKVAAITERSMRGELDFEASLRERVRLLKGLPVEKLEEVWSTRIKPAADAGLLLALAKKHGMVSVLVSGGFTFFTERVARLLGFDHHVGNRLEIVDGKLTGEVIGAVVGPDAKLKALQEYCQNLGILSQDVLALGDGANDIPMLKAAGLGIACHAKPRVVEATDYHISHTSLKTAAWAMGLPVIS